MENKQNNFYPLINVRDISDFLYCDRKVWLRKIEKLREPPNVAIIKGKIRHDILDELNKTESNIVCSITHKLSLEQLGELYKNHLLAIANMTFARNKNAVETFRINKEDFWQGFWKYFTRDVQLRVKSISKLLKKDIFGYKLWQELEPKYLTEFKIISYKLGLSGRIDRIIIKKDDSHIHYIPCEVKNKMAKSDKPYESELIQLTCYALLLEEKFSAKVASGFIEYKDRRIKVKINEDLKNRVMQIIDDIKNFSQGKIPKISSNFNKCRHCGLREECFKI